MKDYFTSILKHNCKNVYGHHFFCRQNFRHQINAYPDRFFLVMILIDCYFDKNVTLFSQDKNIRAFG